MTPLQKIASMLHRWQVEGTLAQAKKDRTVKRRLLDFLLEKEDWESLEELSPLLARLLPHYLAEPYYSNLYQYWEKHGFHLTPNHFYSPLPDTRLFTRELWETESEMVGVNWNTARQLDFLQNIFPKYKQEYDQFPREPTEKAHEFYFDNTLFSGTDALVLYCFVRHAKPRLILEVGSGFSTRVSAQAVLLNGDTRLVSIEPNPSDILRQGFPGLTQLIAKPVQDVGIEPFLQLSSGDILFIDTSHVTRTGGEVNFLYLEVLPRIKPGVIIHIHDIFLPREYPEAWVIGAHLFSNEQYLVHAFLAFNHAFEVLFGIAYMDLKYPQLMREVFSKAPFWGGDSLWIRRKE